MNYTSDVCKFKTWFLKSRKFCHTDDTDLFLTDIICVVHGTIQAGLKKKKKMCFSEILRWSTRKGMTSPLYLYFDKLLYHAVYIILVATHPTSNMFLKARKNDK